MHFTSVLSVVCHPDALDVRLGEEEWSEAQHTNGSHAVVEAAWSQPALGYLKAPALPKQHVASLHSHILPDTHLNCPTSFLSAAQFGETNVNSPLCPHTPNPNLGAPPP